MKRFRLKHRRGWFAAVVAAAFALAGCETYTGPFGLAYDEYQPYPEVTVSEASLSDALRMREPVVDRLEDGLLQVTLPLRSASDDTLHVEYRFDWLDERGRPIEPRMNWRPLRISPRQPDSITVNSTSVEAETYHAQLRWGRP